MPAKSAAQRGWVYGVKGKKWAEAHHYDNPGKLPAKVAKKKAAPKRGKGKGRRKK